MRPLTRNPHLRDADLFVRDPAFRDWDEGYDPGTWLDRSILATREEIFPLHGLHALY